jgi:hypothetical protein
MLSPWWKWAAALLLLISAFSVGRFSAPKPQVKVETVEKIVTKVVQAKAEVKEVVRTVVVTKDRVVHQDGTSETHTETHTTTGEHTEKTDTKVADTKTDTAQKLEVHTDAPRWGLSLLGGVDTHLTPYVGASCTYRVLGPFTVGAWGLSTTDSFKPVAGLSLGVTF